MNLTPPAVAFGVEGFSNRDRNEDRRPFSRIQMTLIMGTIQTFERTFIEFFTDNSDLRSI